MRKAVVATVVEMALYTAPTEAVATEVAVVVEIALRNKTFHKSTIHLALNRPVGSFFGCQAIADSVHSFVLFTWSQV